MSYLPDCRAYELASPPGAEPYSAEGKTHGAQAAIGGERIAWYSYYPPQLPQAAGQRYLSTRGGAGWSTVSVIPPQSAGTQLYFACQPSMYFSADLSEGVLTDGFESIGREHGVEPYCGHNEPSLFSRPEAHALEDGGFQVEPEGFQNLFLRDTTSGSYHDINLTPLGTPPSNAAFEGASRDFTHVVFADGAKLTPDAPTGEDLYLWDGGKVTLVTYLPEGKPAQGTLVDGTKVDSLAKEGEHYRDPTGTTYAVAADGSRILFTAGGRLYMRINAEQDQSPVTKGECTEVAKACTVQIDASQAGGTGGGGSFLWASPRGEKVFFTDSAGAKLTSDTQVGSGVNLYDYEVATRKLTDLTSVPSPGPGVLGVSGLGEDENGQVSLYFVATAVLSGTQENSQGAKAEAGKPNLYRIEAGSGPVYIATLNTGADATDWGQTEEELEKLTAQVSPDGQYVGFDSSNELTGYNNRDIESNQPDSEIYLYDAATKRLACASCAPVKRPMGSAKIIPPEIVQNGVGPGYTSRQIFNDGRVFFNSPDALLAADGNGVTDVYEYDAGRQSLVSGGTSPDGSYFVDASGYNARTEEEGENAFFFTTARLVGADTSGGSKLYDARVGGGFPEPPASSPCGAEECRSASPIAPAFSAPASVTFAGPGNIAAAPAPRLVVKAKSKPKPCRKGFVRRHAKCVRARSARGRGSGRKARGVKRITRSSRRGI